MWIRSEDGQEIINSESGVRFFIYTSGDRAAISCGNISNGEQHTPVSEFKPVDDCFAIFDRLANTLGALSFHHLLFGLKIGSPVVNEEAAQ